MEYLSGVNSDLPSLLIDSASAIRESKDIIAIITATSAETTHSFHNAII